MKKMTKMNLNTLVYNSVGFYELDSDMTYNEITSAINRSRTNLYWRIIRQMAYIKPHLTYKNIAHLAYIGQKSIYAVYKIKEKLIVRSYYSMRYM